MANAIAQNRSAIIKAAGHPSLSVLFCMLLMVCFFCFLLCWYQCKQTVYHMQTNCLYFVCLFWYRVFLLIILRLCNVKRCVFYGWLVGSHDSF